MFRITYIVLPKVGGLETSLDNAESWLIGSQIIGPTVYALSLKVFWHFFPIKIKT